MSDTQTIPAEVGTSYDPSWGYGLSRGGQTIAYMTDREWYDVVREMTEHDPTVGAVLFAVEMTLRRVRFRVESASDDPEARRWAEFVEECIDDLEVPWPDKLAEIISFVPFGFALFEIVYKRRGGATSDPSMRSKFDDGLIGWRKWAYRSPESKREWKWEDGELAAFVQSQQDHQTVEIPMSRCLLFKSGSRYSNPEGVSILKRAYHPWRIRKEIETAESIGVYRDLAGMLMLKAPGEIVRAETADMRAAKKKLTDILRGVHRGSQEGILLSSDLSEDGNPLFEAELLSSGGARQFDTSAIIDRYKTDIAMTMLADFILMGHQNVGTYSTSQSKIALFNRALQAWLDVICSVVTEQGIDRLLRLNGVPQDYWPILGHEDPDTADLATMASALQSLVSAGAVDVTPEVMATIHDLAGLPPPSDEEPEDDTDTVEVQGGEAEEEAPQFTIVPAVPGEEEDATQAV